MEHETDVRGSDHCPILITLDLDHIHNQAKVAKFLAIREQFNNNTSLVESYGLENFFQETTSNPDAARNLDPNSMTLNVDKPPTVHTMLKARSRTVLQINLLPSTLREGYLPRIETEIDGVYMGEGIVTNTINTCKIMAINTCENDVSVSIAPCEIYDFDYAISDIESSDRKSNCEPTRRRRGMWEGSIHNSW